MLTIRSIACMSVLSFASAAFAHPEGDVNLTSAGGKLYTGLISEDETQVTPGVRVFFGEIGLDVPNVATEPGWLAVDGTFAAFTPISFEFMGSLKRWDGSSFVGNLAETMTLSFGPASATSPLTDVMSNGFAINTDEEGGLHDHPAFALNNPASDGIYMLALRFSAPGFDSSEPFWMLFGQNAAEADIDAAFDYAVNNVPAPSVGMLGLMTLACASRRRR